MRVLAGGLAVAVLFTFTSVPVNAQTVLQDNGTPYNTTAIDMYQTYGSDMVGMTVTGWVNGTQYTGIWGAREGNWGVVTDGFDLLLPNVDTFNSLWRLFSTGGLSRLVLDGAPGNTIFDRTFGNAYGTNNSFFGKDFIFDSSYHNDSWGTTAYYRNALGIGGAAPVGDVFTMVDIQFERALYGAAWFSMDTDNALLPNDINSTVPEPATLLLLLTGMVPLAGVAIRRRKTEEETEE